MKRLVLIALMVFFVVGYAQAFDLVEVDMAPDWMVWWIHSQDFGLAVDVQTQIYGIPGEWNIVAAGPIIPIPGTKLSLCLPAGVRLAVDDPVLPVTHWVGKINVVGSVGPLSITIINDKSWGRHDNPDLFFYKDIVSYKMVGIRLEGFKFGDASLPAILGPMLIYDFGSSTFQVFTGINLRNREERCFKFEYIFKKF